VTKIELTPKDVAPGQRKIVFKHDRCIGDALMFTAGIRDFKLLFPDIIINVESNHNFLWENNPYIERGLNKNHKGVEFYEVGYPAVGNANNSALHFTTMFLLDMIAAADLHQPLPISLGEFCATFANGSVGDPPLGNPKKNPNAREPFISLREKYSKFCRTFTRQRGDIHLTQEEKENNLIERDYGLTEYWVIAPGGKLDFTAKFWDWKKFQSVIDHFEDRIKFVVIGLSDDKKHYQCKLKNVIDLTDYYNDDIRQLLPLVYHATGTVCVPSFLMHLTAAMPPVRGKERKPCVSIFGGREPTTWSWYCTHQVLHTNGAFSCCQDGGCWRARIKPLDIEKGKKHNSSLCLKPSEIDGRTVQQCMNSITAQDVIRAIERYYEGDMYRYETNPKLALRHNNTLWPVETESGEIVRKREEDLEAVEDTGYLPTNQLNSTREREDEVSEPVEVCDKTVKEDKDAIHGEDKVAVLADPIRVDKSGEKHKSINLLGNLNTDGGGEQSLCMIAKLLADDGWNVSLYPWGTVSKKNREHLPFLPRGFCFDDGSMVSEIDDSPLLFYANDKVWDFVKSESGRIIVDRCRSLAIGINYVNGPLPKCQWLSDTGKLKAVIFQNKEKQAEWERDRVGFENTKQIALYGAIDLEKFLEITPVTRKSDGPFIVLKHCKADKRKYLTTESTGGDKIHVWQKQMAKDLDTKFYERLLKNVKHARFEFMEAPAELVNHFKGSDRMVFHKWNAMPVAEFLSRGHAYLYRTSNRWRDQYPRVVAEALASGLPVLTEPRDGTADRVVHGDTGFYCVDYDGYQYALKLIQRKEDYRLAMGQCAKRWAKSNLDPKRWVQILEELLL
jgi:ADP-heptose:LPS heptosyltransferase